ncbi:MAG: hypothetical protein PVI75_05670 [Gammaproteobacteria bacterium]|jgi:hypothetical protein
MSNKTPAYYFIKLMLIFGFFYLVYSFAKHVSTNDKQDRKTNENNYLNDEDRYFIESSQQEALAKFPNLSENEQKLLKNEIEAEYKAYQDPTNSNVENYHKAINSISTSASNKRLRKIFETKKQFLTTSHNIYEIIKSRNYSPENLLSKIKQAETYFNNYMQNYPETKSNYISPKRYMLSHLLSIYIDSLKSLDKHCLDHLDETTCLTEIIECASKALGIIKLPLIQNTQNEEDLKFLVNCEAKHRQTEILLLELQGHNSNQVYKLVAKYTEFIESIKKSSELKPHLKKVYLNVNEEYKKLLEAKKQNDSFWRNTIIAISTILCGCGYVCFRKHKYKIPRIKNNKLSPSKPKPIKKTKKRKKQKSPQKKKPTPLLNKTYKHNNKFFAPKEEPKNDDLRKYKDFATKINRILRNMLNKKIKKPIMHLKIEEQQSVFTVAYHNDYKNYIKNLKPTLEKILTKIKTLTWENDGEYEGKRNHWYFRFTIPNNKLEKCLKQIKCSSPNQHKSLSFIK